MTALRVTGVACLLLFALLRGVPAHAQAYVPGVTCPSGQAMTGYTPQSGIVCAAVGSAVFDNKLINPTMEIDQAHEGSSVSLVSGTPSYVVDGVKIGFVSSGNTTNATVSCQRASDAPTGFTYSLKCTVGTAASGVGNGDYLVALIPIEADNIQDALLPVAMRAVPTTVSLWDGAGTANKGSQYTGAWTDGLTAVTIAQTSTKGLVWIQSVNTAIMQHYAADSRL